MSETVEQPAPRRHSRRALLGGAVAIAAGGAAAATVVLAQQGEGAPATPTTPVAPGGGTSFGAVAATATPASQPIPQGEIDDPLRAAAHLLRRAGFGGTREEVEEFAGLSRDERASRLVDFESIDNSALEERLAQANLNLTSGQGLRRDMQRWWLMRMAYTARPLEERMTLLWHGLLTTQISQIQFQLAHLMIRQNELFRANALPVYDDLLQAVSKDPAMMMYLNTLESTKEHPNENYARELMELFSMGVDTFTEDDVREAARAFTGWRLTRPPRTGDMEADMKALAEWEPEFFVARGAHDQGSKTVLGQTGNLDGEDVVRIIMEQDATGQFICRRLFKEFVHNAPYDDEIDALVEVWDRTGHDVREVVRAILVSDAFYSEEAYRAIVRSPVQLVVGMVRQLEVETTFDAIPRDAAGMGQVLFDPPNVAGWPGGASWLSSGTLFARANFVDSVLMGRRRAMPAALDGLASAENVPEAALSILVDGNVPDASRDALYAYARAVSDAPQRAAGVAYLVLCSPEFQLI